MMKVFPENIQLNANDLSVYEMDQLINMELERQKEIEQQLKRKQNEMKNKINFRKH